MKAITVGDLEAVTPTRCQKPECQEAHDHLREGIIGIRASCHPEAALSVFYVKGTGRLVLLCSTCRKPFALIAVGSVAKPVVLQ